MVADYVPCIVMKLHKFFRSRWWSVQSSSTCFGVQCFPFFTLYTKSWTILRTLVWASTSFLSKSTPSSSGLSVNRRRPWNINWVNIRLSGTHYIICSSLTTAPVYSECAIMSPLKSNSMCTISRNPSSGGSFEGIVLATSSESKWDNSTW